MDVYCRPRRRKSKHLPLSAGLREPILVIEADNAGQLSILKNIFRTLSIIGIISHSIFSTAERISSSLAQICSTDNSKSDYSKTRRIRFFLPWREGLRQAF